LHRHADTKARSVVTVDCSQIDVGLVHEGDQADISEADAVRIAESMA
jgi:hypothetical protein